MIIFQNFRKEKDKKGIKLICDVSNTVGGEMFPDQNLWISTDLQNGYYLNERVCDGYLIAGMAFGMYYGQDVHICGKVSKRLYKNIMNYGQQILLNHDPGLKKIHIQVDGFLTDADFEKNELAIGSPCSFGVDSLSTLYDRWLNEDDKDYKINRVFSFNCGINGTYGDPNTSKLHDDRMKAWRRGFGELGIPIVDIDTNIHLFLHNRMYVYAAACFLGRYFCILNMQGGLKKYYIPNGYSYRDILQLGHIPYKVIMRGTRDIGLSWEEAFLVPMLSTEHIEITYDGAQYQRTEKIERISNWKFSHRYLNVCQPGAKTTVDFSKNCSRCVKCLYTMLGIDLNGKLDLYKKVFDTKFYYANKYSILCEMVERHNNDLFTYDTYCFAKEKHMNIPTEEEVRKYYFYKWRFPNIDSYIEPISDLLKKYKDEKIIVWGAGWIGSHVLAAMDILNAEIDGVVDSNEKKQDQIFFGYTIKDYGQVKLDGKKVIFICGKGIYKEVKKSVGDKADCIDIVDQTGGA